MAKIKAPRLFSSVFGVSTDALAKLGALDPTLNVDTPLFIDPALLEASSHKEMAVGARATYNAYFSHVIDLLVESKIKDDTYWRSAALMLRFPEIKGTCLGYGADSISGSGIGRDHRERLVRTASDIVRLGVRSPDLFVAMALFEAGIGADRVGDMTTNVILPDLVAFNNRILPLLSVKRERFNLGPGLDAELPRNHSQAARTPVILVPSDVLNHLPVASDWDSAMSAASSNEAIRTAVNAQIGEIWKESRSRNAKEKFKTFALSSAKNFKQVLEIIESNGTKPYDQNKDPDGIIIWRHLAGTLAKDFPLELGPRSPKTVADVKAIVEAIIGHFRFLVEMKGLWTELYEGKTKKPRREASAQKLFFAVATSYCNANGLDVTPEAETGNGPVDFKFSLGGEKRIVVEVKLSTNGKLVHGYVTQTTTYQKAEEACAAYFLLIDVGRMGKKDKRLFDERNRMVAEEMKDVPQIALVDAEPKRSASRR